MSGLFYQLGKRAAPAVVRARWLYRSLTGDESDRIKAEYAMGCYLTYLHTREGNLERDPKTVRWLNSLCARLSRALVNRERRFQVRCTSSPEANAFALPGGFLFVSTGLIDLCGSDTDEIAFVLGHEMGHVVKGHAFNRIVTSEVARLLSQRIPPLQGPLRPIATRVIRRLVTQGYSRRQELEADRFATRLTRVAGYDPEAAIPLFDRLRTQTGTNDESNPYFSSHPPFKARIEKIRQAIEENR